MLYDWQWLSGTVAAEKLSSCTKSESIAIGIGHDVTRYYRRAVMIAGAEQLGVVML